MSTSGANRKRRRCTRNSSPGASTSSPRAVLTRTAPSPRGVTVPREDPGNSENPSSVTCMTAQSTSGTRRG
ncbi:MAG TPA: hypothetical protein VGO62_04540 [Myxococcota bacterium]